MTSHPHDRRDDVKALREKDRERFAISAGGVVAVGKGVWI
jgi:hypothetical protein